MLKAIFQDQFETDESMKDIDFDDLQSQDDISENYSDASDFKSKTKPKSSKKGLNVKSTK